MDDPRTNAKGAESQLLRKKSFEGVGNIGREKKQKLWRYHPDYPEDDDEIQVKVHLSGVESHKNSSTHEKEVNWHGR
eukprot:2478092-Karenia_brevis.AAC.1